MKIIIILLILIIPMLSIPPQINSCKDNVVKASPSITPQPTATSDLGQIL